MFNNHSDGYTHHKDKSFDESNSKPFSAVFLISIAITVTILVPLIFSLVNRNKFRQVSINIRYSKRNETQYSAPQPYNLL